MIGHVLATHVGKRTRILDGSFTYVELMKHYHSSLDESEWQKENLLVPKICYCYRTKPVTRKCNTLLNPVPCFGP